MVNLIGVTRKKLTLLTATFLFGLFGCGEGRAPETESTSDAKTKIIKTEMHTQLPETFTGEWAVEQSFCHAMVKNAVFRVGNDRFVWAGGGGRYTQIKIDGDRAETVVLNSEEGAAEPNATMQTVTFEKTGENSMRLIESWRQLDLVRCVEN